MLAHLPEQSLQAEFQNLLIDAENAVAFIRDCAPTGPAGYNIPDDSTDQP